MSSSPKKRKPEVELRGTVPVMVLAIRHDAEDPDGTYYFKVPMAAVTDAQMTRLRERQGGEAFDVRVKPGGRMIAPMGGMGGSKPRPERESYDPTGFFDLLLSCEDGCKAKESELIPFGKTGYHYKFAYEFSSDKLLDAGEVVEFFARYDS